MANNMTDQNFSCIDGTDRVPACTPLTDKADEARTSNSKDGASNERVTIGAQIDIHREIELFTQSQCGYLPAQLILFLVLEFFYLPFNWFTQSSIFMHRTCVAGGSDDNCSFIISDMGDCPELCINDAIEGERPTSTLCPNATLSREWWTVTAEWRLLCDRSSTLNHIVSVQFSAQILGAFVAGQLANVFGRKKVMFGFYVGSMLFQGLTALAHHPVLYAAIRFLTLGCVTASMWTKIVLMVEIAKPNWRPFIALFGAWGIGGMMLTLLAYLAKDWRKMCLIITACASPYLITWFVVPESPRWLLRQNRVKEAETVFHRLARWNGRTSPDFTRLRRMVGEERKREAFLEASADDVTGENDSGVTQYSYLHLCRSWRLAKITLICAVSCLVGTLLWWTITLNVGDLAGNFYINFLVMSALESPLSLVFSCPIFYFLARKRVIVSQLLLACALFAGVTLLGHFAGKSNNRGPLITVLKPIMVQFGRLCVAIAWMMTRLFTAEQFPTTVRNLGVGLVSTVERSGAVMAPLILLLKNSDQSGTARNVVYGVLAVLSLSVAVMILQLPETKNQPLIEKEGDSYGEVEQCETEAGEKNKKLSIESEENGQ